MAALAGKVALVTGGGNGLGRAIVERFLREGAAVSVLERSEKAAKELIADFSGQPIHVVVGDVRSPSDNHTAATETVAMRGGLDIFIGNAGLYDNRVQLADLSLDELSVGFDELFAVNVKGYMLGIRAALEPLRARRGCVVLTASVSSHTAGFGGLLYVTSKHAVAGMVRQLAWELAPDVRVNGVAPGYIPTSFSGLSSLGQGPSTTGLQPATLPLGEIRTAEDYTDLYVLLASNGGRVATGAVFGADGGLAVAGPAFKGWD